MLNHILDILSKAGEDDSNIRPTELYNEGWLLRLTLSAAQAGQLHQREFELFADSTWFCEALLPTQFKAKRGGDNLAETRTHADAAVGHIKVGSKGKADLTLQKDPTQLCIFEAKMYSRLAPGTTNFQDYNQAARNVACIAELISTQQAHVSAFQHLAFYVLTPADASTNHETHEYLKKNRIEEAVRRRVEAYRGRDDYEAKNTWFEECFMPTLKRIEIALLHWEHVVQENPDLIAFLDKCRMLNSKSKDREA